MPNFDGTGPKNKKLPGRGLGKCAKSETAEGYGCKLETTNNSAECCGRGNGQGRGQGMGRGKGRGNCCGRSS